MDVEKVKDVVLEVLKDQLPDAEAAGVEEEVEAALKEAEKILSELTEKLAESETKRVADAATIEALTAEVEELKTACAALESDKAQLSEEVASTKGRAEKAEGELLALNKDMTAAVRVKKLEEAKVLRLGDALDKQKASVREMSDEEFASYLEDLISFRDEILKDKPEVIAETASMPEGTVAVSPANTDVDVVDASSIAEVTGLQETASISEPANRYHAFAEAIAEELRKKRELR